MPLKKLDKPNFIARSLPSQGPYVYRPREGESIEACEVFSIKYSNLSVIVCCQDPQQATVHLGVSVHMFDFYGFKSK